MNTTHSKTSANLKSAEGYYNAILAKDFDKIASYLNDNVHFIGPLAEMQGREAVVSAAKNLSLVLQDIHIRSKFSAHNQIMLAYDFMFPAPIGCLRAAVLMEFTDELISKIDYFMTEDHLQKKGMRFLRTRPIEDSYSFL